MRVSHSMMIDTDERIGEVAKVSERDGIDEGAVEDQGRSLYQARKKVSLLFRGSNRSCS